MNHDSKSERMSLFGRRWPCQCGAVHDVPVREAIIEAGAMRRVPELLSRHNLSGPMLVLADENTMHAAGEGLLEVLGNAGVDTRVHIMTGRPKAEYKLAEDIAGLVPDEIETIITCGSGTITDLGKWAAFKRGIPLVAVATAPSMNGYASGIAALTKDGLKATTPVQPAFAVVADLDVLTAAPMEMIRAGLGDVMSKPVCNADWRLASLLRAEHFCMKPFELIRDLEEVYAGRAHLLPKRDPAAIAALAEALIFSGISMIIAGSSSPASGGEHLIAHFLDMRAEQEGREPDFHGTQVGVATLVTARLYEQLMKTRKEDLDRTAISTVWERGDEALARCCELLPHARDAIKEAFAKKRRGREEALSEAKEIAARWDEIKNAVAPFLRPESELRAILEAAGAKSTYKELGVSRETFDNATHLALCIRNRFTVLDLAFAVGISF